VHNSSLQRTRLRSPLNSVSLGLGRVSLLPYTQLIGPALTLMPEEDAARLVLGLQCAPNGGVVRVVRGLKCANYESLHTEVAAALQFPNYYGENWDAMDECITDLEWAPASWYLVHVSTVEAVLPAEPRDFRVFLRILASAHDAWHHPEATGQSIAPARTPFHTVLSGSPEGLARVRAVIAGEHWAEA
jgi:RNAse (barnase) inhibitor barstar